MAGRAPGHKKKGSSPRDGAETLLQELSQVFQDGLAVQAHKLFTAYLRGCRLCQPWYKLLGSRPHLLLVGPPRAETRPTSFIVGMSAACVQKQSCTETKVRPFLGRETPSEARLIQLLP